MSLQDKSREIYAEICKNIERCNNVHQIDRALIYYYETHDPQLKESSLAVLSNADLKTKKERLKILAAECINRDMISLITTGKWGGTSNYMNDNILL